MKITEGKGDPGENPRDDVATMGASGKGFKNDTRGGRVNELRKGSDVPEYTTYEDYDVFSGGKGNDQKAYMTSTFHTSEMTEGDPVFRSKAELMGDQGSILLTDSREYRTHEDIGEEDDLNEQEKEAAL